MKCFTCWRWVKWRFIASSRGQSGLAWNPVYGFSLRFGYILKPDLDSKWLFRESSMSSYLLRTNSHLSDKNSNLRLGIYATMKIHILIKIWDALYSNGKSCKLFKKLIMSKGREFWKVPKPVFKLTRFRKKVDHSIWLFTVHEFCDSVNSHVVHSAWDLKSNLNLILLTIFSLGFSQFRPCWGSMTPLLTISSVMSQSSKRTVLLDSCNTLKL